MKRFTYVTTLFSVSVLAVWMIFQLFTASQFTAKKATASLKLQPSHNEIMKAVDSANKAAIPVTGVESRTVAPAPVYDASGRIVSLNPNRSNNEAMVLAPAASVKVAPVYDASGTLISDPTGTIQAANNHAKIAPMFDANGNVISDPTGTILSESNP